MSGYDDVLEMAFGVTGVYTAWEVLFFYLVVFIPTGLILIHGTRMVVITF